MQSLNINQLVIEGLAPLSYASQHVVHHMLDMNILEKPSINDIHQLSNQRLTSDLFKSKGGKVRLHSVYFTRTSFVVYLISKMSCIILHVFVIMVKDKHRRLKKTCYCVETDNKKRRPLIL